MDFSYSKNLGLGKRIYNLLGLVLSSLWTLLRNYFLKKQCVTIKTFILHQLKFEKLSLLHIFLFIVYPQEMEAECRANEHVMENPIF